MLSLRSLFSVSHPQCTARKKRKLPFKASSKLFRFAAVGNGQPRPIPGSDTPPLSGASSAVEVTVTAVTEEISFCSDELLSTQSESSNPLSLEPSSELNLSYGEKECSLTHRPSSEIQDGVLSAKAVILEGLQVPNEAALRCPLLQMEKEKAIVETQGPGSESKSASKGFPEVKSYASRLKESSELEEIGSPSEHITGVPFVLIPDENIAAAKEEFKDFIFARFQGDVPSMGRIIGVVNAIWAKSGPRIFVHNIEKGGFLLKITNVRTRELILSRTFWNIAGFPMFVAPWSPDFDPDIEPLTSAIIPVELRNVPYLLFNKESLSRLATAVGKPVSLAPETKRKESFQVAKLHVKVDLTTKLPTKIISGFSSGKEVEIAVSYPWLPTKCEVCKKYGHPKDRCRVVKKTHKEDSSDDSDASPRRKEQNQTPAKEVKDKNLVVTKEHPLAVSSKKLSDIGNTTESKGNRGRTRSRSRCRPSRSRGLPRVRHLSSPPELSSYQLEEGEICEDVVPAVDEKPQKSEVSIEAIQENQSQLDKKEEDSMWFTKHSKNYRRAVRQLESWKASGAVGLPPKSARFLTRGPSSGGDLSL